MKAVVRNEVMDEGSKEKNEALARRSYLNLRVVVKDGDLGDEMVSSGCCAVGWWAWPIGSCGSEVEDDKFDEGGGR